MQACRREGQTCIVAVAARMNHRHRSSISRTEAMGRCVLYHTQFPNVGARSVP